MAITISGENNNDRILAADGVIDQISGINFSGIITASHINVGSNIQLGNAGIVTATTFVGNITGNVNSTSPLLLQTGGSERFRITGNNELGIAGANYGSSGQVLTSGGSGSAVSWTTIPTQVTIANNGNDRIITGGSGTNLNGESGLTYNGTRLDVTTGDLQVIGGEGGNAELRIVADQGDDGADYWRFQSAASDNKFNIATYASGSWVDKVSITSEGNVIIAETMAVNRPRIVLSAPNDGTNYRHLFGANLQVNSSGTFTTPTANISGGGWEYLPANSLNSHGHIRYLSAPDTNATSSTPLERLRIDATGRVLIGVDATTNNDSYVQAFKPTGNETTITVGNVATSASGLCRYDFAPSNKVVGARIECHATEDFSTGANRTADLVFITRLNGTLSEKVRIASDGKFHTGDPASLAIDDFNITATGTGATLSLNRAKTGNASDNDLLGAISFQSYPAGQGYASAEAAIRSYAETGQSGSAAPTNLIFYTKPNTTGPGASPNERLRITSDGKVLINSSTVTASYGGKLQLTNSNFAMNSFANNQHAQTLLFAKSRATSGSGGTIVGSGDFCGHIEWYADDGENTENQIAKISGQMDGSPGVNDTPGKLLFYTTADGANTSTLRMQITNGGVVHIGSTAVSNTIPTGGLDLQGNNTNCILEMGNPLPNYSAGRVPTFRITTRDADKAVDLSSMWGGTNGIYKHITMAGGATIFYNGTNDTEIVRITGSALMVGTTSDSSSTQAKGISLNNDGAMVSRRDGVMHYYKSISTGGYYANIFLSANTTVGSIFFNSGGTQFNTSSDYRRKENVVSLTDGISKLKQLKPYRFNFKDNPSETVDGFLAHEAQEIVPHTVTGTKDQVSTSNDVAVGIATTVGEPIYQQMDLSKLVPLLTAALQDEISKREALEARVAALESS